MRMPLTASDIVTLYRPTPCPLRVYLRQQGVEEEGSAKLTSSSAASAGAK